VPSSEDATNQCQWYGTVVSRKRRDQWRSGLSKRDLVRQMVSRSRWPDNRSLTGTIERYASTLRRRRRSRDLVDGEAAMEHYGAPASPVAAHGSSLALPLTWAALAVTAAAIVLRLPSLAEPIGIDQGIFATAGMG
jgi:hypothetical protein